MPHASRASLQWTLNRLRSMAAAELAFRVRRKVQGTAERAGFGRARPPAPRGDTGQPWVRRLPHGFDTQRYIAAADRILGGVYDVFALEGAQLGFPPRWNVDPKTGREAPLIFGKTLDYRDAARVGDIKYLWEINRHLELVTLAQAWHLSGEIRFVQGSRVLLDSWFEQCPYPRGVNWCVSLEHAVRLVNWSCAWHLLGSDASPLFAGAEGQMFRSRWLRSVYQHCHFIARYFSRHSSANNHLMGEATGLFVGALTWPLWPASVRWAHVARAELSREALAQVTPDGVNREQAFWYHHAVADMMLIAGLYGRANGHDFGTHYWARLEAMLDFIASVMDVRGNVPQVGDADDGVLLRLVPLEHAPPTPAADPGAGEVFSVYRSLLATGAVLYGRPDFARKAACFDDKSRWLLGDAAAARFAGLPPHKSRSLPVRRAFPQGGYYVLGQDFETENEIRIVADAGPLGYLSIAAHGHADALAFTLSVGGHPILVDPGTYAYHTERTWRDYFRGTRAHNTVVVDGQDQSVIGGSFLWLKRAHVTVERFEEKGGTQILVASHDGYRRLADPVTHRRTLVYDTTRRVLTVRDELECRTEHDLQVRWHFAPECRLTQDERYIHVARAGVRVALLPAQGLEVRSHLGDRRALEGWHSCAFDRVVPAPAVSMKSHTRGPAVLTTVLFFAC